MQGLSGVFECCKHSNCYKPQGEDRTGVLLDGIQVQGTDHQTRQWSASESSLGPHLQLLRQRQKCFESPKGTKGHPTGANSPRKSQLVDGCGWEVWMVEKSRRPRLIVGSMFLLPRFSFRIRPTKDHDKRASRGGSEAHKPVPDAARTSAGSWVSCVLHHLEPAGSFARGQGRRYPGPVSGPWQDLAVHHSRQRHGMAPCEWGFH